MNNTYWESATKTLHSVTEHTSRDGPFFHEPCALGVDEAGRGPVLGPMVYGIAFAPVSKLSDVKNLGVDDSKKLTENDRDILFAEITSKEWMGWAITSINPGDISEGMFRRAKYSLNQQAHDVTVDLIRSTIAKGVRISEIYVDTVGSEKSYQSYLERHFPGIAITVAKKADAKYPIVSAASIVAKVSRDSILKNWRFCESTDVVATVSQDFGSGYPGDPKTKKWLRDSMHPVFGFPSLVRFSWSTCVNFIQKNCATVMWPDDEKPTSITSYFTKATRQTKAAIDSADVGQSHSSAEEGDDGAMFQDESNDDAELSRTSRQTSRKPASRAAKRKAEEAFSDTVAPIRRKVEDDLRHFKWLQVDNSRDPLFKSAGLRHVAVF